MKILFFGRLADMLGSELEVDVPPDSSVGQLRDLLIQRYPDAAPVLLNRRAKACVGDALVHDHAIVGTAEVVEFLPPVSGG